MSMIVELSRLHARDAAGASGRARGSLSGASIELGAGVHAFLGAPEDGTLALSDALTGARRPVRGSVTVARRDPARASFIRARIGALAAEPRLPEAPTVRDVVRLAMRARGESGDRFDAVLDPLGLSNLQARAPRSLAYAEKRAIDLAIALSTPAPLLLALHEPLADVALPRLELLPVRLREAADAGACVVVTTSSPSDARALADHVLVLHNGVIAREARGGGGIAVGETALFAWVHGPGARDLCAALAMRPEIHAASFREEPGEPAVIELRGETTEACALALISAAVRADVEIEAIGEQAPSLGDVRASTEALWRDLRARRWVPPPAPPLAPAPPPAPPPPTASPDGSTEG
jgi:ABC-2 type transport system ATP-binding protein